MVRSIFRIKSGCCDPKRFRYASTADLEGKSLVAQTGATGEAAAKEVKGAKVTGLKNVQDIMNALSANNMMRLSLTWA